MGWKLYYTNNRWTENIQQLVWGRRCLIECISSVFQSKCSVVNIILFVGEFPIMVVPIIHVKLRLILQNAEWTFLKILYVTFFLKISKIWLVRFSTSVNDILAEISRKSNEVILSYIMMFIEYCAIPFLIESHWFWILGFHSVVANLCSVCEVFLNIFCFRVLWTSVVICVALSRRSLISQVRWNRCHGVTAMGASLRLIVCLYYPAVITCSRDTDHVMVVMGHWPRDTDDAMLVTWHWPRDVGHVTLIMRCWSLGADHVTVFTGPRPSVTRMFLYRINCCRDRFILSTVVWMYDILRYQSRDSRAHVITW